MDVVITYVNGSDKLWINNYNKYVKKPIEEARYRDWGTLPYLIKGIRKFMPFIDKIFLVVSGVSQVPENIDLTDVRLVYHNMIIPERYLPCFNSCTIEMFLHNIPGLGEEFIYFNDDTFVIKPMKETDFFVNGKPVLNPHLNTMSQFDTFRVFQENCVNSTKLIRDKFVPTYPSNIYIRQEHIMRPMLKSTYKRVWDKCRTEILKSLTRTRHNRNCNAYLFNNYDYMTGNYVLKELNYKLIKTGDVLENIVNEITSGQHNVLCMNDNSDVNYENRKYIQEAFCSVIESKEYKFSIENIENNIEEPIEKENKSLKIALCAIAKNENLYIREWVEWYKNLGISKIFLYDNNAIDGERFEDVISDYINNGYVEVINVRGAEKGCVYDTTGLNLQPKCYIECYEQKVNDFDWICFFDIDEFLAFKGNWNLFNFLNQSVFTDTNTILVPWTHYDDNDLYDYDIRPVTRRFTRLSKHGFHGVKSIVRTKKHIYEKTMENLIHCFKLTTGDIKFSDGNCVNYTNIHNWYTMSDMQHNLCPVVLNHYKTKSISEYLVRHLNRHWGTGKKYTDQKKSIEKCYKEFFLYNIKTNIKESILKNFDPSKNGKYISYYKKLKSLNKNEYIERYNKFIDDLGISKTIQNSNVLRGKLGIITLTTWKNRIDNVHIVLCNLLEQCPKFHIVLVLSEQEFPKKEQELPVKLIKLVSNGYVEILWTPNNYKTCKKLIFTIEKYKDSGLPIITADDDCLYITNYAISLYDKYKNGDSVIRYNMYNVRDDWQYSQGPCTLYAPSTFNYFLLNKQAFLAPSMAYKDDQVITKICKTYGLHISYLHRGHIFPFVFINETDATNDNTTNIDFINCYV